MPDNPPPEPALSKLLRCVEKFGGTDLYLEAGAPPGVQLGAAVRRFDMRPLTQEDLLRVLREVAGQSEQEALAATGQVAFDYWPGPGRPRFRLSAVERSGQLRLTARRLV
jgi:Tfp pilus assembly ATPase PilU